MTMRIRLISVKVNLFLKSESGRIGRAAVAAYVARTRAGKAWLYSDKGE
jgi:hypothetical protein